MLNRIGCFFGVHEKWMFGDEEDLMTIELDYGLEDVGINLCKHCNLIYGERFVPDDQLDIDGEAINDD